MKIDKGCLKVKKIGTLVVAHIVFPADSAEERRKYIGENQRDQRETNPLRSHHN